MTVKCIKAVDKAYILDCYLANTTTIQELSVLFGRSTRTIERVLAEAGHDPVKHRKPKVDIPLDLPPYSLGRYCLPAELLAAHTAKSVRDQPVPWYRKVLKFVGIHA